MDGSWRDTLDCTTWHFAVSRHGLVLVCITCSHNHPRVTCSHNHPRETCSTVIILDPREACSHNHPRETCSTAIILDPRETCSHNHPRETCSHNHPRGTCSTSWYHVLRSSYLHDHFPHYWHAVLWISYWHAVLWKSYWHAVLRIEHFLMAGPYPRSLCPRSKTTCIWGVSPRVGNW